MIKKYIVLSDNLLCIHWFAGVIAAEFKLPAFRMARGIGGGIEV